MSFATYCLYYEIVSAKKLEAQCLLVAVVGIAPPSELCNDYNFKTDRQSIIIIYRVRVKVSENELLILDLSMILE